MSRDLSVIRAIDLEFVSKPPQVPVDSREFEAWEAESIRRHLFSEPLGSESVIREFWSHPAERLGLPLLASIYDEGFYEARVWQGDDLNVLEREIASLRQHWSTLGLPAQIASDLAERAGFFEQAIAIARKEGAVIVIT